MKQFFLALAASMIGSVALSILTLLFHWVFFRETLGDGQYVFVFYLTVPIGAVLAGMTSLVRMYLLQGQTDVAGGIARWGGGILVVLFVLVGIFVLSGTGKPTLLQHLTATLFWFGLPLLWSGLLLWAGLRLRAGQ
jgi:hypothetical protein